MKKTKENPLVEVELSSSLDSTTKKVMENILNLDEKTQRVIYYGPSIEAPERYHSIKEISKVLLRDYGDRMTVTGLRGKLFFNNKLFYKWTIEYSFGYDRTKKNIKFFKGSYKDIINNTSAYNNLLSYINADWLVKSNKSYIRHCINKSVFQDIIMGKITNPKNMMKKYYKTSWKINDFHYKLFNQLMNTSFSGFFVCLHKYTTNPEYSIKKLISLWNEKERMESYMNKMWKENKLSERMIKEAEEFSQPSCSKTSYAINNILAPQEREKYDHILQLPKLLNDCFEACKLLNEKINPSWGYKRLVAEHCNMSDCITQIMVSRDNYKIEYKGELLLPKNTTLLSNQAEIHREGLTMHHCLYTCYYNRIKKYDYFALRCELPERCTVGISLMEYHRTPYFEIDQIYLKYDKEVKPETRKIFENWLKDIEVQRFFFKNIGYLKVEKVLQKFNSYINLKEDINVCKANTINEVVEENYYDALENDKDYILKFKIMLEEVMEERKLEDTALNNDKDNIEETLYNPFLAETKELCFGKASDDVPFPKINIIDTF